MAKLADNGRQRKRMRELTNQQAGEQLMKILRRWVTQTSNMDGRIKTFVDAAPGTLGEVIDTLPAALRAEATAVVALIDSTHQAHKASPGA